MRRASVGAESTTCFTHNTITVIPTSTPIHTVKIPVRETTTDTTSSRILSDLLLSATGVPPPTPLSTSISAPSSLETSPLIISPTTIIPSSSTSYHIMPRRAKTSTGIISIAPKVQANDVMGDADTTTTATTTTTTTTATSPTIARKYVNAAPAALAIPDSIPTSSYQVHVKSHIKTRTDDTLPSIPVSAPSTLSPITRSTPSPTFQLQPLGHTRKHSSAASIVPYNPALATIHADTPMPPTPISPSVGDVPITQDRSHSHSRSSLSASHSRSQSHDTRLPLFHASPEHEHEMTRPSMNGLMMDFPTTEAAPPSPITPQDQHLLHHHKPSITSSSMDTHIEEPHHVARVHVKHTQVKGKSDSIDSSNVSIPSSTITVAPSHPHPHPQPIPTSNQLIRTHAYPSFRSDGDMDTSYLSWMACERRRYLLRCMYVSSMMFLLIELLYIAHPGYRIEEQWPCLIVRGIGSIILAITGIYLHIHRHDHNTKISTYIDTILFILSTFITCLLIIIDLIRYTYRPTDTRTFHMDLLLLSITLSSVFAYIIVKLRLIYAITSTLIILVLFNVTIFTIVETMTTQMVLVADAYLVLVLFGLLYTLFHSESSRLSDITTKRQLFLERRKSEKLLQSMLPAQILQQFLDGQVAHLQGIATIGYAQVELGEAKYQSSPSDLMQKLHDTFKRIDGIVSMYAIRGVNKIETVSKTYLLCAGLLQDVDDHASAMIEVSLEIMHMVTKRSGASQRIPTVLKIGISTGPVVGGIIGTRRRFFRVFGDTVNVSARMATSAQGTEIQISSATYAALNERERAHYKILKSHTLEIKGKGAMKCYVVDGREDWVPRFGKSVMSRGIDAGLGFSTTHGPHHMSHKSFIYHKIIARTSISPYLLSYQGPDQDELECAYHQQRVKYIHQHIRPPHLILLCWLIGMTGYTLETTDSYTTALAILNTLILILIIIFLGLAHTIRSHNGLQHLHDMICLGFGIWSVACASTWGISGPIASCFALVLVSLYSCGILSLPFTHMIPILSFPLLGYLIALLAHHTPWWETVSNMVFLSLFFISTLFITHTNEYAHRISYLYTYALHREQSHMESFLNNLLPKFVLDVLTKSRADDTYISSARKPAKGNAATSIIAGGTTVNVGASSRFSMYLPSITVFESDIVGYTKMASQWSAAQTLNILNTIFSQFDELVETCHVEKIETIGDGSPDPVLNFALSILGVLRSFNDSSSHTLQQHHHLAIRMGICTGPCYGGVIGTKIPRFHLFGHAHDTAIAIEQNGRPGSILVSRSTYELSKTRYKYQAMPEIQMPDTELYQLQEKYVKPLIEPTSDITTTVTTTTTNTSNSSSNGCKIFGMKPNPTTTNTNKKDDINEMGDGKASPDTPISRNRRSHPSKQHEQPLERRVTEPVGDAAESGLEPPADALLIGGT